MHAVLVLEDGRFPGKGFGAEGSETGEIVFNTSMTGYQEILTNPSYYRQRQEKSPDSWHWAQSNRTGD